MTKTVKFLGRECEIRWENNESFKLVLPLFCIALEEKHLVLAFGFWKWEYSIKI